MNSKIIDVLFTIMSGVTLGYWLPPSVLGITMELIGITAFIIGMALPVGFGLPLLNEDNWLYKLRFCLFGLGGILTLISTMLDLSSAGFVSFVRWMMVICWWTIISSTLMKYSNSFQPFQLSIIIFVLTGLGLGLGYLGSIYFTLIINF
jgi:hypothetical protein